MTLPRYVASLLATLVVEVPIVAGVLRGGAPPGRRIGAAIVATLVTHPILWWVMPRFFDDYTTYIVTCEIGIVFVETAVLRWLTRGPDLGSCFAASALANGASLLAGQALQALGIL